MTSVGFKRVAKLFREPALLFAGFKEKCREADADGYESAELAHNERRTRGGQKHSRVDGVADSLVGTCADEFMARSNAYGAAPIRAKVRASPDRERHSERGEQKSREFHIRAFCDKAPSEPAETHERFKEKDVGSRHRQDLPHSLGTRFPFLARLLVARGEKPIHPQNNPAANGQRKRYLRHIVLSLYLRRVRTYCSIPTGAKLVLVGSKGESKMVS